jgi:hypothetical protein
MDKTAKPFAARVYFSYQPIAQASFDEYTYNDSVIPGEDGELIQPSDEVPARSDVASKEDTKGEDRDGVHEVSSACPSTDTSYV